MLDILSLRSATPNSTDVHPLSENVHAQAYYTRGRLSWAINGNKPFPTTSNKMGSSQLH